MENLIIRKIFSFMSLLEARLEPLFVKEKRHCIRRSISSAFLSIWSVGGPGSFNTTLQMYTVVIV